MMMKKFYLILTCVALCACGGGNAKQPVADVETTKDTMQVTKGVSKPGGIPVLDVNKKYPKKTLYLQDLGDVEYVPIETTESMLWRGRDVYYVDDKYIIVPTFSTYWNFLFHQVELLVPANGKIGSS